MRHEKQPLGFFRRWSSRVAWQGRNQRIFSGKGEVKRLTSCCTLQLNNFEGAIAQLSLPLVAGLLRGVGLTVDCSLILKTRDLLDDALI